MPFPYTFPFRFGDAKVQKDEGLDTEYGTLNTKSPISNEYGTSRVRSGYPSSYKED